MKHLQPHADILLYHRANGDEEAILPPPWEARGSSSRQRHTLFTAENFVSLFDPAVTNQFDAEATYRQGSLFRDGGYEFVGLAQAQTWPLSATCWDDLFTRPIVPFSNRKSITKGESTITWGATHCDSHSGREDLIRALQKHVDVAIHGTTCMANVKSNESYPWPLQMESFRRSKFHLTIENSRCNDYVTEKIYAAYARGQIPIYFGAPNVDEFVPSRDSYINILDFRSAAELAAHLKRVDSDKSLFESYFKWRKRPFSTYGRVLRNVIYETIPLGNNTGPGPPGQAIWYKCGVCYALQRERRRETRAAGSTARVGDGAGAHSGNAPASGTLEAQASGFGSGPYSEHDHLHPRQPVKPLSCFPGLRVDLGGGVGTGSGGGDGAYELIDPATTEFRWMPQEAQQKQQGGTHR